MRYSILFSFAFQIITLVGSAQNLEPGMHEHNLDHHTQCITSEERESVKLQNAKNRKLIGDQTKNKSAMVLFDWPVAQNPAFDYNSTFAISNYVDHDPSFPNNLLDYDCGNHTYDTNSGYNHQGIDIFLWPFDHNQVAADQTYAVAAAPGVILNKADGNIDNNCSFNSMPANFVIVEHSDGSESWYWHLKNGSVTTKAIGASVVVGEYLGVVASSGNSTGPHLHFECFDSNGNLIDPYAGNCNSMNSASFWNNQKPYWEPTINTILTHSAPPSLQACPNMDITNISTSFNQGQTMYLAAYFHDQVSTKTTNLKITYPNGANLWTWTVTPSSNFRAAYWWWPFTIPSAAPNGRYTFEAELDGDIVTRDFTVGISCPPDYSGPNMLTGTQSTNADFETNGVIQSTQKIDANVDYDSATHIDLLQGFEVYTGRVFQAFIDGCGNLLRRETSSESEEK